MSKQKRYLAKQKAAGLVQCQLWIPSGVVTEFRQMAEVCANDRDQVPFMSRSITTGRMKKAVD